MPKNVVFSSAAELRRHTLGGICERKIGRKTVGFCLTKVEIIRVTLWQWFCDRYSLIIYYSPKYCGLKLRPRLSQDSAWTICAQNRSAHGRTGDEVRGPARPPLQIDASDAEEALGRETGGDRGSAWGENCRREKNGPSVETNVKKSGHRPLKSR